MIGKVPEGRDFDAELRALACGDNSCRIIAPKGMATNGGCRCGGRSSMSHLDPLEARKLWQALAIRRTQVEVLQEALSRLKR
jgi:hypothetical protein